MFKKLITATLSVIVFFSFGLIQQTNAQSPIDFGIKGGLNIANLAGAEDDLDSRTGIHAGLVLDFSFPLMPVGIESGIYYSQKGAQISEDGMTATWKLDYVEVPILAKISVGPPGPFSPHIVVGPYAAYNINSELDVSAGSASVIEDFSEFTSDIDFGGVIGVGADFSLGVTKLNIQARYSRGLLDVNDNGFEDEGEHNSVFSISAGIMF
ncbi:hypothetical protein BH23BAC3_BH23BAC3_14950 [soil metagenome]